MPKKVKYSKKSIQQLPNNKPSLYTISTQNGKTNYVGIAKRGRVNDRIQEHLGEIPGAVVSIQQFSSIKDARKAEQKAIDKKQPKYNQQGK